MNIPVPDFSEDDSDFESMCCDNNSNNTICNSATLPKVKESISQHDLFSLAKSCDPNTTFMSTTSTGIEYDKDNPIYKTKTCTLYIGRCSGRYYALKTSPNSKILMHEWEIYKKIGKYPTIIDAVDLIQEPISKSFPRSSIGKPTLASKYFLQLDYAFGGSISNTIQFFDSKKAWKVLAHIASALNHIHKNGYIHLDISPSNILICQNKQIYNIFNSDKYVDNVTYKLTDFGTVLKEGCFDSFCEGAGPYVSPEALYFPNSRYPVSYATDIWSLGAVMFEIVMHSKMPRDPERYDAIRKGSIDLSEIIPHEFEVVLHMLNVDPSLRPTAEQILQIPKIKEILNELDEQLKYANDQINMNTNGDIIQKDNDNKNDLLGSSGRKKIRQKRFSDDDIIIRRQSFDGI